MKIEDIKVGKEYYKSNNNGHLQTFTCLRNDSIDVMIKIHAQEGFGCGRLSHLNSIECDRYVVREKIK